MKNMIIAVLLAAAPAAAQEFADSMPAARDILAKTNALRSAGASEKTVNAELWSARQAYRAETNTGRKARLRQEFNFWLAEALAEADKKLGDRAPSPELNQELWNCRRAYQAEADPGRKARMREDCDRMLDAILMRADQAAAPLPALTYDPREIRVEIEGENIRVYHKELPLATMRAGGAMIGRHVLVKLAGYLEAARQRAAAQGRKVSIDDMAVALYNETGFFNRMPLEEPGRFGAIIRLAEEAAPSSR